MEDSSLLVQCSETTEMKTQDGDPHPSVLPIQLSTNHQQSSPTFWDPDVELFSEPRLKELPIFFREPMSQPLALPVWRGLWHGGHHCPGPRWRDTQPPLLGWAAGPGACGEVGGWVSPKRNGLLPALAPLGALL
jgi:hypothetical protein